MDLELLKKGLEYTKKKKRWVLILGALGFTGYGAYRTYNLPSVVKKRQRLLKLFDALLSVAEMVSDSAEAIGIVSKDLKEFIQSDSDQIPGSVKQIAKITRSNEFSESLIRTTRALTVGVFRGTRHETTRNGGSIGGPSGFSERVIDKLFSDASSDFASVVVGSFARNLAMAFYSNWHHETGFNWNGFSNDDDLTSKSNQRVLSLVEAASEDKCRELIGDCIRLFVSTTVTVYLDKTMNINTYDELFSGLTNPKHEAKVRDILVSVCNRALETLVHTSHHLLATKPVADPTYPKIDFEDSFNKIEKTNTGANLNSTTLDPNKLFDKNQDGGWVSKISSTLEVPSNRKFVLDMTGTIIFETVRSFLKFLLKSLAECVKRSVDVVHHNVVDMGIEVVRYASSKSSKITTICLTLCLYSLNSPLILAPC